MFQTKKGDFSLSVFKMITGVNEPQTSKHRSCKCKYEFDVRKCNSKQKWNNDKCRC